MRHTILGAVLALAIAPALAAFDDKAKPGAPAEQFKALVEEQTKLQKEISESLKAAKTTEERQELMKVFSAKVGTFPARFLELAKKHPKDPVAVEALVRVVTSRRMPEATQAMELLLKDYVQSPHIGAACEPLAFSTDPAAEKLLRSVLEKNPHDTPQAMAAFTLATMLKNRGVRRGVSESEAAKFNKEAEQLFDRVVTKHAAVENSRGDKLETAAKRELHELRNLVAGKVAPDIVGEDIDGQKFSLSDYRGKVVMLDFWGHW
jgi:hypothetical protein